MYKICCDDKCWYISKKRVNSYENTKFWNIFYGDDEDNEYSECNYATNTYYIDMNPKMMDKIISVLREEDPFLNINEANIVDQYLGTNYVEKLSNSEKTINDNQIVDLQNTGVLDLLNDLCCDFNDRMNEPRDIYLETCGEEVPLNVGRDDILPGEDVVLSYDIMNDISNDSNVIKQIMEHKKSAELSSDSSDMENVDVLDMLD